jgi:hypothetical protein
MGTTQRKFTRQPLGARSRPFIDKLLKQRQGCWRVMQDAIGTGRCFPDLCQLCKRTRQVLMVHQECPIYAFHW